jgi:hypothetical protein
VLIESWTLECERKKIVFNKWWFISRK